MLCRLGFLLARGFEVGYQGDMDIEGVLTSDIDSKLSDGLEKRQRLDIAERAANYGDDANMNDAHASQEMDTRIDLLW